jgi:hypothetical protein
MGAEKAKKKLNPELVKKIREAERRREARVSRELALRHQK